MSQSVAQKSKRIIGTFIKQELTMGGKYCERIREGAEVEFDATFLIIGMDVEHIREFEDDDYDTDEIGRQFVEWDGPCEVNIVDSIKEFFGVEALEDITDEMVEAARLPYADRPWTTVDLLFTDLDQGQEVSVKGKVNLESGDISWGNSGVNLEKVQDLVVMFPGGYRHPAESSGCVACDQDELTEITNVAGLMGIRQNLVSLKLDLDVLYDLSEVPLARRADIIAELTANMRQLVANRIADGVLTGSSDAMVESYSYEVSDPIHVL